MSAVKQAQKIRKSVYYMRSYTKNDFTPTPVNKHSEKYEPVFFHVFNTL